MICALQQVWKRLIVLNQARDVKPTARKEPIQYGTVDPNMQIATASDETLVTPFTYFTMQQVRPCNLDNSGNGSRSAFDFGFPGLECTHCAGHPNSRRFFYRTAEILSGKTYLYWILECSFDLPLFDQHTFMHYYSIEKATMPTFQIISWHAAHVHLKLRER